MDEDMLRNRMYELEQERIAVGAGYGGCDMYGGVPVGGVPVGGVLVGGARGVPQYLKTKAGNFVKARGRPGKKYAYNMDTGKYVPYQSYVNYLYGIPKKRKRPVKRAPVRRVRRAPAPAPVRRVRRAPVRPLTEYNKFVRDMSPNYIGYSPQERMQLIGQLWRQQKGLGGPKISSKGKRLTKAQEARIGKRYITRDKNRVCRYPNPEGDYRLNNRYVCTYRQKKNN